MAVQSLWSISWLMQVNGYSRAVAAEHLAGMSVAMLLVYLLIGLLATGLARRGIRPVMLLAGGLALSLAALTLIVTEAVAQTRLLWIAYGSFASFGTLVYSQTAAGFPVELSGRVNTALNLMVFLGAFGVQWGLGVLIDLLQAHGQSVPLAYRSAFLALLTSQVAAYAWFLLASHRSR